MPNDPLRAVEDLRAAMIAALDEAWSAGLPPDDYRRLLNTLDNAIDLVTGAMRELRPDRASSGPDTMTADRSEVE
jgi:hypothetical protein